MRRRQFVAYSALASLAACTASSDNSSTSNGTKIVFWTMQLKPTFEQYMNDLIAQFQSANAGVQVEWVDIPWGDMETKILGAIASQTAPDVVNLNPQFASKLAEKNALVDMAKVLAPEAQGLYFPSLWRANQLGDVTFGLPWYAASDVTIFNRDIFNRAGLAKPPQTYQELRVSAQQIKERTGKFACLLTMDGGQILESMVQMGMPLVTPDLKAAFNNAQGEAAFGYWVEMFTKNLLPREMLTEGHRKAIELYQAGEVAILLTGTQFLQVVAENAPDIAKFTEVSGQITGSSGKTSVAVMNVAVPASSSQQGLALKFAQFLTNDANQLAFAQVAKVLPSTRRAAQDDYFNKDRVRSLSAQQLQRAELLIPPVRGIDNLRKIIYEELQLAMLGQKSVPAAVASAAERWQA